MKDKAIQNLVTKEEKRQKETINLIASENVVSRDVREALGSVLTNKYAEGYSKLRYYGGNSIVDELEDLTKERALKLFVRQPADLREWSVNIQPYSGSPANLAVYHALVPISGKIMGMELSMGGHLTHGHRVSVTGKLWKQVPYGVDKKTEKIDYESLLKLAKQEKPNIIVAGATAYSRIIDFKKFREVADASSAILMVDMSHFAGLVAGGAYPSPFPYADIITTTTHKTLRGPRAAMIFSKQKYAKAIDKAVFPGLQGGPHMNAIAAVAVALDEASKPEFKKYAKQIVKNAQALAAELKKLGWRIVSGGTDSHLFLVDTMAQDISGKTAGDALERVGIIVNKNTIPYDARSPVDPSGIRIGTPAMTTRGMKEKEMKQIAILINATLRGTKPETTLVKETKTLAKKFTHGY
ncbi:MAG: serine hydroxymethyltransferase [Candidatus Jorgensenbacteria bacterium]|nr:serine hydroxymethyltransferase [Candidatus Jorgensenbacteria bacterium]